MTSNSRTESSLTGPLILGQISLPPGPCSYLIEESASLTYRQIAEISPQHFEDYLSRGWRRHGSYFFRPGCPQCRKCRSLRVNVRQFRPTKSQQRCWRKNADVEMHVGPPTISAEHLDIFNRYHADMHRRRGWRYERTTSLDYANSFLTGRFTFAHEFRYFRQGRLCGVGLVDITPHAASSVYFYHDPAWRPAGPGVYSLLAELAYAAQQQLDYLYLGYWIAECPSMSYKSRFGPHELLATYVDDDESPLWIAPEVAS